MKSNLAILAVTGKLVCLGIIPKLPKTIGLEKASTHPNAMV
jgi:hypothetical protein